MSDDILYHRVISNTNNINSKLLLKEIDKAMFSEGEEFELPDPSIHLHDMSFLSGFTGMIRAETITALSPLQGKRIDSFNVDVTCLVYPAGPEVTIKVDYVQSGCFNTSSVVFTIKPKDNTP